MGGALKLIWEFPHLIHLIPPGPGRRLRAILEGCTIDFALLFSCFLVCVCVCDGTDGGRRHPQLLILKAPCRSDTGTLVLYV